MDNEIVITVQSTEVNQYGDMVVMDTMGVEHKVKKRLSNSFDLVQVGRAVVFTMEEFKGFPYVNEVRLFDGKPPENKRIEPITAGVEKHPLSKDGAIARAVAMKASVDYTTARMTPDIGLEEGLDWVMGCAEKIEGWLLR